MHPVRTKSSWDFWTASGCSDKPISCPIRISNHAEICKIGRCVSFRNPFIARFFLRKMPRHYRASAWSDEATRTPHHRRLLPEPPPIRLILPLRVNPSPQCSPLDPLSLFGQVPARHTAGRSRLLIFASWAKPSPSHSPEQGSGPAIKRSPIGPISVLNSPRSSGLSLPVFLPRPFC